MHDEFQLSLCRDRCKGGTWRLHSTAVTSILLLAVLVAICFSDAVASLDSPCSLVNSSCFNASRCIQGFTFYIEPSKGMYNFETLSAAIAPTNVSLQHRCQRILQNPTSGEDNVETWAAECLVFVISEYFEVSRSGVGCRKSTTARFVLAIWLDSCMKETLSFALTAGFELLFTSDSKGALKQQNQIA